MIVVSFLSTPVTILEVKSCCTSAVSHCRKRPDKTRHYGLWINLNCERNVCLRNIYYITALAQTPRNHYGTRRGNFVGKNLNKSAHLRQNSCNPNRTVTWTGSSVLLWSKFVKSTTLTS